jgi:hypothetical protein
MSKLSKSLETFVERLVQEASEVYSDPLESFPGYADLTLTLQDKAFEFTDAQLDSIRKISRTIDSTNEIAKNIQFHYRNHIIGNGVTVEITPAEYLGEPQDIGKAKPDSKIKKMKENWQAFCTANKFDLRLIDTLKRAKRDGEFLWRIYDTNDVPTLRFIDPYVVRSSDSVKAPSGIKLKTPTDYESVIGYVVNIGGVESTIPEEKVIHGKRNVDMDTPRGIPDNWPLFTNFRRLDKLLLNVSTLTQIQSAIALIRQHENQSQARVQSLVNKQSDGRTRTDSVTGKSTTARKLSAGTILDAPKGTTYEFPAHSINTSNFIGVIDKELAQIAAGHVLPVDWLLAKEPTDPLSPGSPVIANFSTEQMWLYDHVIELFWRVQELMGINTEREKTKYAIWVFGPRLAVGKSLDEARVLQVLQQVGSVGPRTISRTFGFNYNIERADTIRHIATLQPGEIAPGSAGGTFASNNASNDGMTTSKGTPKSADAGGGKQ